ncbi:hypothetical protein [Streptomyces chrestomyceticus]|uniref:hypothetical protein n=1 Tax=Streptomyces chrestomyceticus TaxID=68185 RepID=UPI0033FBD40A
MEYLNRDEEALGWWEKAAVRGDEDAQDYLDVLRDEAAENTGKLSSLSGQANQVREGDCALLMRQIAVAYLTGRDATVVASPAVTDAAIDEETERLLEEIEEYLMHPDRMTDGRRR